MVQKAHVEGCLEVEGGPLFLDSTELELLKKPAMSVVSDEDIESCGHLILISYNSLWNSQKKLKDLLKQFLKEKKSVQKEYRQSNPIWWDGICDYKNEFTEKYLPKKIVLIISHVSD